MEEAKLVNSINLVKILNDVVKKYNSSENIVMSCIFKDTKILSYGISKPGYKLSSKHAEIDACNNLYSKYNKKDRNKFGNLDILIIRFSYDNDNIILKNSKPCRFCIKSLEKVKIIKNLYFTENNNIYKYRMEDVIKNIDSFLVSSGDWRVYKY
jgi:hypothetical protein